MNKVFFVGWRGFCCGLIVLTALQTGWAQRRGDAPRDSKGPSGRPSSSTPSRQFSPPTSIPHVGAGNTSSNRPDRSPGEPSKFPPPSMSQIPGVSARPSTSQPHGGVKPSFGNPSRPSTSNHNHGAGISLPHVQTPSVRPNPGQSGFPGRPDSDSKPSSRPTPGRPSQDQWDDFMGLVRPTPQPGRPGDHDHNHRPGNRPSDRPGNRPGDRPTTKPNFPDRWPDHRPDDRPGDRPGNRPDYRPGNRPGSPGNRPGDWTDNRPGDRPGYRPGNRPGDRPDYRPDNRPGNRPDYRPKPGYRPEWVKRPGYNNHTVHHRPSWVTINNNQLNNLNRRWTVNISTRPDYWAKRPSSRTQYWNQWGNGIRTSWRYMPQRGQWFNDRWWSSHHHNIGGWHYGYGFDRHPWQYWWSRPQWTTINTWFVWGSPASPAWRQPIYYDYGTGGNVIYQNNQVYFGDDLISSADDFAMSAAELATVSQPDSLRLVEEADWMPLGTFALSTDYRDQEPTRVVQLAVNRQGIISGTLYNTLTDRAETIQGRVDQYTQRVAFRLGDSENIIAETGLYNLTQDEVPLLMHFGTRQVETYLLVRLDEPEDWAY